MSCQFNYIAQYPTHYVEREENNFVILRELNQISHLYCIIYIATFIIALCTRNKKLNNSSFLNNK